MHTQKEKKENSNLKVVIKRKLFNFIQKNI